MSRPELAQIGIWIMKHATLDYKDESGISALSCLAASGNFSDAAVSDDVQQKNTS
jgi:hypothetical protein